MHSIPLQRHPHSPPSRYAHPALSQRETACLVCTPARLVRALVLVTERSSSSSSASCSRITVCCNCTSPRLSSSAVRSVSRPGALPPPAAAGSSSAALHRASQCGSVQAQCTTPSTSPARERLRQPLDGRAYSRAAAHRFALLLSRLSDCRTCSRCKRRLATWSRLRVFSFSVLRTSATENPQVRSERHSKSSRTWTETVSSAKIVRWGGRTRQRTEDRPACPAGCQAPSRVSPAFAVRPL